MASAFVPVHTPDSALRRIQDRVQRATTPPAQSPALRTESFVAVVGATHRVRATTSTQLEVQLPRADASNYGKSILLLVHRTVGNVRVTVADGGLINGSASETLTSSTARLYYSSGDSDWVRV